MPVFLVSISEFPSSSSLFSGLPGRHHPWEELKCLRYVKDRLLVADTHVLVALPVTLTFPRKRCDTVPF
jgi:hypothetical protein